MNGNNNLRRNEVEPWRQTNVWDQIDQAVHDEVVRVRVAAKVLLPRPLPNAANVHSDPVIPPAGGVGITIGDGTQPFLEISQEFALTSNQVDNEVELGKAVILATMAAKDVALAEELVVFQGTGVLPPPVGVAVAALPPGVNVQRGASARTGLLGAITLAPRPVNRPRGRPAGVYAEQSFAEVAAGISDLIAAGQPGPYALFLAPPIFADTFRPLAGTLAAAGDRIKNLVPGGFYPSMGLLPNTGLLVSLGGEPTSLVVSQDAATGFTQQDPGTGMYRFRVSERIQFVVRDPRALLRLDFVP